MAMFMIGYDLGKPGQEYNDLFEAIKSVSNAWWHNLDSTWIVSSDLTASDVLDRLKPHLDESDKLLVAEISAPLAWRGLSPKASDWLRNNF